MDDWDRLLGEARWDVVIPTDDESIVRRRRALAPIQVLTDLERNKAQLDGDYWHQYDLFNIALAVIDQVALAMGISAGQKWDDIIEYAIGQATRQVPGADRVEWEAVAERVVVSLVTTEVEVVPYLAHGPEGPQWLAQRFRLLYVHAGSSEGEEYLRASEQAINIFVEALDLDIEAAQIANEAQLAALIARGAIDSAVQIARLARYQSIQYQERVRRIVADTLIDPDAHDWVDEVPDILNSALLHVRDRLDAEAVLLDAVAERRTQIDDMTRLAAANDLIEILRECRHRHDELHSHLIGARSRLREALDDRLARPPKAAHRANIGTDLLVPYLALSAEACAPAVARLVAAAGGIATRWWPSLALLAAELCAPARKPSPGEQFIKPEFDEVGEAEWWEVYESVTDALLGEVEEPLRLSQLLARVDELADTLSGDDGQPLDPELLVSATVHAAHRAWAARLAGRVAGDRVVIAADTGDVLATERVRSADLLLIPGLVMADIQSPHIGEAEE